MRIVYYGALLMIYSLVFRHNGFVKPILFFQDFIFRTIGTGRFYLYDDGKWLWFSASIPMWLNNLIAYLVMMGDGIWDLQRAFHIDFYEYGFVRSQRTFAGIFQIMFGLLAIGIIFETIYSAGIGNFIARHWQEILQFRQIIWTHCIFSYKNDIYSQFFLNRHRTDCSIFLSDVLKNFKIKTQRKIDDRKAGAIYRTVGFGGLT